jgi:hypothetical protein
MDLCEERRVPAGPTATHFPLFASNAFSPFHGKWQIRSLIASECRPAMIPKGKMILSSLLPALISTRLFCKQTMESGDMAPFTQHSSSTHIF